MTTLSFDQHAAFFDTGSAGATSAARPRVRHTEDHAPRLAMAAGVAFRGALALVPVGSLAWLFLTV